MEFARLTDPNMYGYKASDGYKRVEVVRCYSGEWSVFRYLLGEMQRDGAHRVPFPTAMKEARDWMQS